MTTDVLDKHQRPPLNLSYESTVEPSHQPSAKPVLGMATTTMPSTNSRRTKYSTQTTLSSTRSSTASINQRHSGAADLFSVIRSLALKPFRTSSMSEAMAGGQTSNVIGGTSVTNRSPVNLVRYRPLSDVVIDQTSYTQSTRGIEEFVRHMGWRIESKSEEACAKWNIAEKFLNVTKLDVSRAIELYKTHEEMRQTENCHRISINNPQLAREIQSNKFFSLPPLAHQPLSIIYILSNINQSPSTLSLSTQDRELIAVQGIICQLDAATESVDVQKNGLNVIYDMQQSTSSQLDINLSKKLLKIIQTSYPVILKNLFLIAAPKQIRSTPKTTLYTVEQMRDYFTNEYGYSLDSLPQSLGGKLDLSSLNGSTRYQQCRAKVTNPQSTCSCYYLIDNQPTSSRTANNIIFFKNDSEKAAGSPRSKENSPGSSLVAIASLKSAQDKSSQTRVQKRESSFSSDHDKRQRSHESLIEEELPVINQSVIPKEQPNDCKNNNENSSENQPETIDTNLRQTVFESKTSDVVRMAVKNPYRPLNDAEFLSKTESDIRKEFRKIPDPPAKDSHAAKDEINIEKSRYRDVIPGEPTRVKLQPDGEDTHDFINANYVTGYPNQEKAYIFTQGPLQWTVRDFWRMIWQENISIIVMTTNLRESGTNKCYPYWPSDVDTQFDAGFYQIKNMKSDKFDSFRITTLTLQKVDQEQSRTVYHAHYLKWPDHGVPSGTKDALLFLEKVEYYRRLTQTKAPVLLHCSAGIGRTGTFCAIDIGIKRYLDTKLIDVPSTVIKMRHERSGSVQTEDQYVFIYFALMDFIKQQGNSKNLKPIEAKFSTANSSTDRKEISETSFIRPNVQVSSTSSSEQKKKNRR